MFNNVPNEMKLIFFIFAVVFYTSAVANFGYHSGYDNGGLEMLQQCIDKDMIRD
jgi:hypothetical protein